MYKTAVIGEYDSIYGFAALGIDTYPTDGEAEIGKLLRRIAEGEYGIIYITESAAQAAKAEIDRYAQRIVPAIVLIPGVTGNTGEGVRQVRHSVEQAVGSDILFGNEE